MSRVHFDTSTILAALVEYHPQHARAIPWMQRAISGEIEGAVGAHSLAEAYAVLTKGLKVSPSSALKAIESNLPTRFDVVELTADDYFELLRRLAGANIIGGTVYDGLIGFAAWKSGADLLVTLNKKHFDLVFPERTHQIIEP